MFTCDGAIRGLNELTELWKYIPRYQTTIEEFSKRGMLDDSAVSFRLVEILLLAMGFVRGRHVAHDSVLESVTA